MKNASAAAPASESPPCSRVPAGDAFVERGRQPILKARVVPEVGGALKRDLRPLKLHFVFRVGEQPAVERPRLVGQKRPLGHAQNPAVRRRPRRKLTLLLFDLV